MIESSEKKIAEELAKAGTDPDLIGKLKKDRITVDKELPPMEFLLKLFDVPCCPRGELVAFTGKAKSGKTFVMSMMMAAAAASKVLAFHRTTFEPLQVLWIDTEQSDQSTQDILKNRLVPMVCGEGETFPENLYDIFNVRTESWTERLPLLMAAIDMCHPDLVILDGVRDLVDDINNGQLAHEVTESLMKIAQQAKCCIVCVIHQNKAAEDRTLRGSIGTELTNKAFEVYECEKLMPSRTFVMTQKHTRKYDITDALYFTVDDRGLPLQVGAPPTIGTTQTAIRPIANTAERLAQETGMVARFLIVHDDGSWEVNYHLLFREVLGGCYEMQANELRDRAMQKCGMKSLVVYNKILKKAIEENIISRRTDSKHRSYYQLVAPD